MVLWTILSWVLMQCWKQVVMAMRTRGGDEAIFQSLHRARELYRNRLQANAAADQLACLFAECAIAEVEPCNAEPSPHDVVSPSIAPDSNETSILAETGRRQIVLDAFSDGSSFICLQCGGLVSNHRKDEHYAYWCCKIWLCRVLGLLSVCLRNCIVLVFGLNVLLLSVPALFISHTCRT